MDLSRLALHMPDADQLTGQEVGAALELKPAAMLVLAFAQWDADKGVSRQISDLVYSLGHDRLYVRFHADPHPSGYARTIGGPEAWGRLCARRMGQYYGALGVTLHAILANEADADYEGGLNPQQASDFYRRALAAYEDARPQDVLHVPAPTGAPQTHRAYLQQYKRDGWLMPHYWIDAHGYGGDLENSLNAIRDECPAQAGYAVTETNDLDDFGWPLELIRRGDAADIFYFTLNWARGGEGRVQPPSADDAAKRMSLLRFPDRYQQFKATIGADVPEPVPEPAPEPEEPVMPPLIDPWEHFSAERIAEVSGCPVDAVQDTWPRIVSQLALCGINERPVQVAAIGTTAIETASQFRPVREAFWLSEDWRRANLRYYPYYGRGDIQRTWEDGYRAAGPAIAALWGAGADDPTFDLVTNPDNLLDPDMAAADFAIYFRDTRTLQGYGIVDAARAGDWEWVRRLVQGGTAGLERLVQVATDLGEPALPIPVQLSYNPEQPPERQIQDWVCSIRAATWALKSVGAALDAGSMQDDMVGHGEVNQQSGLLDHRGYGLAAALKRHLPADAGVEVLEVASWDDVVARAGRGPLCLGSVSLYHWLNVARVKAADLLSSPNPAPNYPSGSPIGDELNRAEFDRWAPWSAVFVDVIPAPATHHDSTPAELSNLVGNAYAEDGVVVPALAGAINSGDWDQVTAVLAWLRNNRPAA